MGTKLLARSTSFSRFFFSPYSLLWFAMLDFDVVFQIDVKAKSENLTSWHKKRVKCLIVSTTDLDVFYLCVRECVCSGGYALNLTARVRVLFHLSATWTKGSASLNTGGLEM